MLVAVYMVGLIKYDWTSGYLLTIDPITASLAAAAGACSLVSYFLLKYRPMDWLIFIAFSLLTLATAWLLLQSGALGSPYIALWMLLSVLAGVFGLRGLVVVGLLGHAYLAWMLLTGQSELATQWTHFVLAVELPLIVSYLIWHQPDNKRPEDNTYSALVQELGTVANKSEIVINAIADGVIAIDEKNVIQLINPAAQAIVGWGKQDATGLDYRSVIKLVDKDGNKLENASDPVQQCINSDSSILSQDISLQTTSGKIISISIHASPVKRLDANGGAIIVFRDITAQKVEERQKAEFISTASHEMRTPVASIEGYLGLALNPATATIDEKARSYLMKAHESSQHLGRLFQDLLDISKAEDGRLKNEPVVVDVIHYSRAITESMIPQATAKGLVLKFVPDDATQVQRVLPVYYTHVDAYHLREALTNLIENAIKYTKQGEVKVDLAGDNDNVIIKVSDSGIGIPSEDIPHLFQKFYRVDNTDTREIGGTGLGLYLTRRLVESMNGRINVESEYGKGSTFTIELNRISSEEAGRLMETAKANQQQP